MKYQYNYGFLSKWLEANKTIPKTAIHEAVGAKSDGGFNSWVRGDGPMPIITMLRFCNKFQIPISAFFRDEEAETDCFIVKPQVDEQLEPNGGYAIPDERRQGDRSALDPTCVTVFPSIVPGLKREDNKRTNEPIQKDIVVGNISDTNMAAILELEAKHKEQTNRLLNIIAEQQKQIADLTNRLLDVK